jgi:hypothetical protein
MAKSKKQVAAESVPGPSVPNETTTKKQPSRADNYGWEPVEGTPKLRGRPSKAADPAAEAAPKRKTRPSKATPPPEPETPKGEGVGASRA